MKKCFSDVENAQGVVASFTRPDRKTTCKATVQIGVTLASSH